MEARIKTAMNIQGARGIDHRAWKPVIGILVILVLIYGRPIYGTATASSRVASAVVAAVDSQPRVDVVLALNFPPEDFHIKQVQEFGTMSGVQGNNIRLRRVSPDGVKHLSRYYWINRIELMQ